MSNESHTTPLLSNEWLQALVSELDNESIIGIILGGSHARGEATPYSDVDIAYFVPDSTMPPRKRFIYRDGHLVSIGAKTVAAVRHDFARPESAYIVVPAMREIRILLDKNGSMHKMQEEALAFTWEPLQEAANQVASWNMMWQAETAHKILGILQNYDERALAYTLFKTLNYLTHTMAVQRGILMKTDNTFYQQVQEAVGLDSAWTHYHRLAAGLEIGPTDMPPVKVQGIAWLHLYAEMVKLFRPIFRPAHREVVEETLSVIERALPD